MSADTLPPLPEPAHRGPTGTGDYFSSYSAAQMRAYAAEAVAAERERCAKLCEQAEDAAIDPREADLARRLAWAIRHGKD